MDRPDRVELRPESVRLVMFPGLGADARQLSPQAQVFRRMEVPTWLPPRPSESLAQYCARIAEQIPPATADDPLFVAGTSLGGMVALEVSRRLNPAPRAIFLVGSCRSYRSVPGPLRLAGRLGRFLPPGVMRRLHALLPASAPVFGVADPAQRRLLISMMADADPAFVQWAGAAVGRWTAPKHLPAPVYHIHGDADRVLPCRLVRPTRVVRGAGHVLNLTHANEVNQFLLEVIGRHLRADGNRRESTSA